DCGPGEVRGGRRCPPSGRAGALGPGAVEAVGGQPEHGGAGLPGLADGGSAGNGARDGAPGGRGRGGPLPRGASGDRARAAAACDRGSPTEQDGPGRGRGHLPRGVDPVEQFGQWRRDLVEKLSRLGFGTVEQPGEGKEGAAWHTWGR